MTLYRLQWVADARNAFPPEQCRFRLHHTTSDCITTIMRIFEQALHDGEMTMLLLLDIHLTLDSLPYASKISAVHALGFEGQLLNYVQAFVTDRTFTMCVRGVSSALRSVTCGVLQGSAFSPFLFILVLAPLTKCLRETAGFPVRSVVYANDVALYVRGPTHKCSPVHACMQEALQCVATFFRSISFMILAPKINAFFINHRAEA
ncbi:hypothetical protein MRX96_020313 [Rhipicephalus microplus]